MPPSLSPVDLRRRWIVGGAMIVLVAIALLAPAPIKAVAPQDRHLTVSARSFAFEPGTVHVNRGDRVTIRLEASDVVHGLYVDGYGVSAQAEPGRPAELTFVADRAGAFRMRCSVSCGSLHPFMIGKLVVAPNLTWLRATVATLIVSLGAVVAFWNRGQETPAFP